MLLGWIESTSAASKPLSPVDGYLSVDTNVLDDGGDQARAELAALAARFRNCRGDQRDPDSSVRCLRSVVYGEDGVDAAANPSSVRDSTLTGLLLDHRGSCAALAALALSLDESAWGAYVLRDHVLLRVAGDPARYIELTDRGRDIAPQELRNRFGAQLDAAVAVRAERFPVYYLDNLAVRLAKDGRDAEAERLFVEAIELGPKEARPRLNFGTFLLERERVEEARRQLEAAVRRGRSDADAWTNLGVAWARLGKPSRARECFERAVLLDPSNQTARANLSASRGSPEPREPVRE